MYQIKLWILDYDESHRNGRSRRTTSSGIESCYIEIKIIIGVSPQGNGPDRGA